MDLRTDNFGSHQKNNSARVLNQREKSPNGRTRDLMLIPMGTVVDKIMGLHSASSSSSTMPEETACSRIPTPLNPRTV